LELPAVELSEADIMPGSSTDRFLGLFSEEAIWSGLEQSGIIGGLQSLGFSGLNLCVTHKEFSSHELHMFCGRRCRDNLLIELRLKTGCWPAQPCYISGADHAGKRVIAVEWLVMQNPTAQFTPERPRLPGQDFPGLGMGRPFLDLLARWSRDAGYVALFNVPEYYHNAAIYSSYFKFLSPFMEGKLRRMQEDLQHEPLAVISYAILLDGLRDRRSNRAIPWRPQWQVKPLCPSISDLFSGTVYQEKVTKAYRSYRFTLDPAILERARRAVSSPKEFLLD